MAERKIRVLLVDDHELARQGLRRMLELEHDVQVVAETSSAEEALALVATLSPDIVLMDIKMPGVNGLEATRHLKKRGMAGAIIILSLYEEYLAQAIEAGAGGYLVKDVRRAELAEAIRRVHKGEVVVAGSLLASPAVVQEALKRFHAVVSSRDEGERAAVDDPTPEKDVVVNREAEAPVVQQRSPEVEADESQWDDVELVITPGAKAAALVHLTSWLEETLHGEIEEIADSGADYTSMRVFFSRRVPLAEMLSQLPEVASVSEEPPGAEGQRHRFIKKRMDLSGLSPRQITGNEPARRLRLVLKTG